MTQNDVKLPSLKVLKRRKEVLRLHIRGYSTYEIASKLHSSRSTVQRDLDAIKSDTMDDIAVDPLKEIFLFCKATNEEVIKEAWRCFEEFEGENNKIGALNTVSRAVRDRVEILQELGIIKKSAADYERMYGLDPIGRSFLEAVEKFR